jgi:hypothetical protein
MSVETTENPIETATEPRDLIPLTTYLERLSADEGLGSQTLSFDGSAGSAAFSFPPGWNIGLDEKEPDEITQAGVSLDGSTYLLTKSAALAVTHAIGLPDGYVAKTPGALIQSHVNYWATHAPDVSFKFLTQEKDGLPVVRALTRESLVPFSNVGLITSVAEQVGLLYGVNREDLLVDFKSHHDINRTITRLVIPEEAGIQQTFEVVRRGEEAEDTWTPGVQISNSLTGAIPTQVSGYQFDWQDEAGVIPQHSVAQWNRKSMGQDFDSVLEFLETGTEDIVNSFNHEWEVLGGTVPEKIKQDNLSLVLADTFLTYNVPMKARTGVMESLVVNGDLSFYGLVNAVSEQANLPEMPTLTVSKIMSIAGALATDVAHRCDGCGRSTQV